MIDTRKMAPFWRRSMQCAHVGLLLLAVWVQLASFAWAQKKKASEVEPAAPAGKNYIASYVVVAAGLALGLAVICRPSSRADEMTEKPKEEDE